MTTPIRWVTRKHHVTAADVHEHMLRTGSPMMLARKTLERAVGPTLQYWDPVEQAWFDCPHVTLHYEDKP